MIKLFATYLVIILVTIPLCLLFSFNFSTSIFQHLWESPFIWGVPLFISLLIFFLFSKYNKYNELQNLLHRSSIFLKVPLFVWQGIVFLISFWSFLVIWIIISYNLGYLNLNMNNSLDNQHILICWFNITLVYFLMFYLSNRR